MCRQMGPRRRRVGQELAPNGQDRALQVQVATRKKQDIVEFDLPAVLLTGCRTDQISADAMRLAAASTATDL